MKSYQTMVLALLWGIDANTETSELWKLTSNVLSVVFWVFTIILLLREWKEDV